MSKSVILCVDDEKMDLSSLMFGGEYRVEVTESGEEALEIISNLQFSSTELIVVVSDQIMPGIKGDELLSKVHKEIDLSKYPTWGLCGKSDF